MDGDDEGVISDLDEAAWTSSQRKHVVEYLAAQNVKHAGVASEPNWFISPYRDLGSPINGESGSNRLVGYFGRPSNGLSDICYRRG